MVLTPKTIYPHNYEQSYHIALDKLLEGLEADALKLLKLAGFKDDSSVLADADDADKADEFAKRLLKVREVKYGDDASAKIAAAFIKGVDTLSKNNFDRQLKAHKFNAMPDVSADKFIKAKVGENVQYIQSLSTDYVQKVNQIVARGVSQGHSLKTMTDAIHDQTDTSQKKAAFLARDQAGTVIGQLTRRRQSLAGVEYFTWTTMEDERVRDSHRPLDNHVFSWDEGYNGLYPGDDYQCRCVAEPVFPDEVENVDPDLMGGPDDEPTSQQSPEPVAHENFDNGKVWSADTKLTPDMVEKLLISLPYKMDKFIDGEITTVGDAQKAIDNFLDVTVGQIEKQKQRLQKAYGDNPRYTSALEKEFKKADKQIANYRSDHATMSGRAKTLFSDANQVPEDLSKVDWDEVFNAQTKKVATKNGFSGMIKVIKSAPEAQQRLIAKYGSKTNLIGKTSGVYSNQKNGYTAQAKEFKELSPEEAQKEFHKPFQVVFHEMAHNIDDVSNVTSTFTSRAFKNKSGKSFIDVLMNDLKAFYDKEIPAKGFFVGEATGGFADSEFYKFAVKIQNADDANEWGNVSDLLDGFTQIWNSRYSENPYRSMNLGVIGGHPTGYYSNSPEKLASEAFAEFTDAYMISAKYPGVLDKMKTAMPNAAKVYDEIVEKLIKEV